MSCRGYVYPVVKLIKKVLYLFTLYVCWVYLVIKSYKLLISCSNPLDKTTNQQFIPRFCALSWLITKIKTAGECCNIHPLHSHQFQNPWKIHFKIWTTLFWRGFVKYKIWGSHSGIAEDSGLLEHGTLLGE